MKLLIVEDDKIVAQMLKNGLNSRDHTVEVADDGADGSFMGRSFDYDAIVLDYDLPRKNGLTVCKEVRTSGRATPIVFLSSNDDAELKVRALDQGADDYITKPFALNELFARLQAVTRRPPAIKDSVLSVSDIILDTDRHIVERGGRRIHLTRKEFNLLEYLMKNIGFVLSRALLLEHVWTSDSNPFSNTVEAHIRNVRKKLNAGGRPNLIGNIPGRGYVVDTPQNLAKL
ncbi:MAG: two-component system, OmpR family, copper resistance phosphate regulon response regulator CusR [Candidatus Parcubacteria bacterium]|nr:two-component system, OmpR family, copper resistance phosphate regulon response regulator CusR [Candidatus Parcubacteria bacterium]